MSDVAQTGRAFPLSATPPAAIPGPDPGTAEPRPKVEKMVVAGAVTVVLFFGVLGGWAALAPLNSAALAPGVVKVDTNRKTVQHLEGGIVREIMVREGETVRAGQVLVILDETQAKASIDLLHGRRDAARALEARLVAQRDAAPAIVFPEDLLEKANDANVRAMLDGQRSIFATQTKSLEGQIAILRQRITKLDEEARGLQGQIASEIIQQKLVYEEIVAVESLVEKGFATKPRLLALKRKQAEIDEELSQHRSGVAQIQQESLAAQLKIEELRTRFMDETLRELRTAQQEIFDLNERIAATRDILQRTTVRAPIDGTIVGLQVHTVGGVIAPGATIVDIVPSAEKLVVEARIDPNDIDSVKEGLPAMVRFGAFNRRTTPPVEGYVDFVSADRFADQKSGAVYFQARITLPEAALTVLDGRKLVSGMQADVMIVTGERTALDYLLAPLVRSVDRSMREN